MEDMTDDTQASDKRDDGSVIVVGPDGRPMGTMEADGSLKLSCMSSSFALLGRLRGVGNVPRRQEPLGERFARCRAGVVVLCHRYCRVLEFVEQGEKGDDEKAPSRGSG